MRIVLITLGLIPLACMVIDKIMTVDACRETRSNQDKMEQNFKNQRREIYKRYSHIMDPEMKKHFNQ